MHAALVLALAAIGEALPRVQDKAALVRRNASPINSGAVTLIEGLEGFNGSFYYINGHKTIGYGYDCVEQGGCDSLHPPITQAEGQTLLYKTLTQFETCVCALPNAGNLNANQYGALVSFAYNSGCGGVSNYFKSDMSSSNFAGICSALPTTNTDGGELTSRRQKEGAFCSQATSDKSGCSGGTSSSSSASSAPASSGASSVAASSAPASSGYGSSSYGGYPTSASGGSYPTSAGSYGGSQPTYASYGGSQSSYGGSQPSYGGSQPSYGGSQPSYGGSQPSYGGSQPTYGSSPSQESGSGYGSGSNSNSGSNSGSGTGGYGSS